MVPRTTYVPRRAELPPRRGPGAGCGIDSSSSPRNGRHDPTPRADCSQAEPVRGTEAGRRVIRVSNRHLLFGVVSLALLTSSIQFSMVSVAIPDLVEDLDAPPGVGRLGSHRVYRDAGSIHANRGEAER